MKKFPSIEYIAAAEDLCQSLQEHGDDESMEQEQKIRNIMIDPESSAIQVNLSVDKKTTLKEIIT